LLYAMDTIDNNLSVNGSAVAALENFLLARFESFQTIYYHKASRAVQIMMVKALEAAREELQLLEFDRPEDYLNLDDYKVWTALKESKKSEKIIRDLEARKLLKCAYERTLFSPEEALSKVISSENARSETEKKIASKAGTQTEDVIIDVPTQPSVPYHNTGPLQSMDIPVFRQSSDGTKQRIPLSEVSRIMGVLQAVMNIVRVYTTYSNRSKVESASRQILGETTNQTKQLAFSSNA
ncbi:MAG TPA: hypothetical protein VFE96_09195, partial [Candidatus Bathyarchaeia archaeon]|nr:hypothetical protein [Candidatus Bathyarchaeia archaeon]